MTGSLLVIYVALWTLLGVVLTPVLFRRRGLDMRLGLIVGLTAGLIGQLTALGPIWLLVGLGRAPMVSCPDCGQPFPRSAANCPHCGYQKEETNARYSEVP